jgi:hypothetical protein
MFKHFTFTAWRLPYSPLERQMTIELQLLDICMRPPTTLCNFELEIIPDLKKNKI